MALKRRTGNPRDGSSEIARRRVAVAVSAAAVCGILSLVGCDWARQPSSPAISRPNVVLYLIDTMRADRVGAYGYERPTSPNLDRLAEGGARFERVYAQDSRTLGSVASLLTSLHTPSHGLTDFGDRIGPDVVTLAQVLDASGYATGSFITNGNAGTLTNLDRGFRHFHDEIKSFRDRNALRTLPERALFDWLDGLGDGPFFAYVHTAEPHRPYIPPPPYDLMFDPQYTGPITGFFKGKDGYRHARASEDVAHVGALYDGEIRFADEAASRLLHGLEERGLLERTVVIFTSDHGEELHDRGGWNHGHTLYEELIHVPLLASGPGIPAGVRIDVPVQLIDVAPTILELAGVSPPASFEGESFLGLLRGRDDEHFRKRANFSMSTQKPHKVAVIEDRWKAIASDDGRFELYDLARDPNEQTDLSAQEPQQAARLRAQIESWRNHERAATPESRPLSRDDEERLRNLGYIE